MTFTPVNTEYGLTIPTEISPLMLPHLVMSKNMALYKYAKSVIKKQIWQLIKDSE